MVSNVMEKVKIFMKGVELHAEANRLIEKSEIHSISYTSTGIIVDVFNKSGFTETRHFTYSQISKEE